jgi:hypothetical protein
MIHDYHYLIHEGKYIKVKEIGASQIKNIFVTNNNYLIKAIFVMRYVF